MNIPVSIQHVRHLFVLAIFLFGVTACASRSDEMQLFDLALLRYEQALRWQDYDVVVSFHKNEYKTLTPEKRKRLKQFRVTSYNVISNTIQPDQRHAIQIVEIKYYNTDYQVVHDLTLQNQWEYDSKANRWYLLNPLPDFK